jgi:hypothetical protein
MTWTPGPAPRVRGHYQHTERPHEPSGLPARDDAPQTARMDWLRTGRVLPASCGT